MSMQSLLKLLAEADPVRSGKINLPFRQLDQNIKYLWEVLQAAAIGSTVYARQQTVEADVQVGMPVYFNATTQRFTRALATAEVDDASGVVKTADSAQVWGVVTAKTNATLADILLYGLDDLDISNAVTGTPAVGTYYLSGAAPGKLVLQKPPVSVAVLRLLPGGRVFVMPQFVDVLDRHTHYQFALLCRPAGTASQPAADARHTITEANSLLAGWLPADHAVFEGKAPPGAVFGYNLSQHTAVGNAWPPLPLKNAYLEWNKALSGDVGFTGVPLGTGGLCVLDREGIWWMSDCYGDVPWPLDYDSTVSASYSESAGAECPRNNEMGMTLFFTKVNFATDSAVVLSLNSGDPRIKVHCFGDPDNPATTGHLTIDLDLNLTVEEDAQGYQALKEFDPATAAFKRGPVAEGVFAVSSNVTLTSPHQTTRTIDSVSRTVYHGPVGITVDPADTKEIDVQIVRLDGAEEGYYGDPPIRYLEFVAGDARAYRATLHVPDDLAIPDPVLKLRFTVLGRSVGTLPQLTFTGRIVPRPADGLDTPLTLPVDAEEFSITCDTVAALAGTNQYVEAESEEIEVAPGDTVYFNVSRSDSDGYAGAVGILRQRGVVTSGS